MNGESKQLASEIQRTLLAHQQMIKTAQAEQQMTMRKLAAAEGENRVLREVIDLVAKGVIDPSDAPAKVDEFRSDPQQIDVIKQALSMGLDHVPSIGSPVGEGTGEGDKDDPITKALIELEPKLRRF